MLLKIGGTSALSLNKKQSSTYNKYACGCFLYAPSIYSAYLQKRLLQRANSKSASPISKKDYYKKQTAQYMNTNCGSALIYKPTYPLKRLRRNVQVCTPFEAFSLTFENSRAARKRYRTYLFQRMSFWIGTRQSKLGEERHFFG